MYYGPHYNRYGPPPPMYGGYGPHYGPPPPMYGGPHYHHHHRHHGCTTF